MASLGLALAAPDLAAQGCVASRGAGVACPLHGEGTEAMAEQGWRASVGYRWLHSDRHYVGEVEQKERQEEGSEVINNQHFVDLTVGYQFNPRFSASLTIPFVSNDRSQVVRSNNVARTILNRFHTQASGVGDIRVAGYAWLLDPEKHRQGNIQIGIGADFPTGEKDATDTFQVYDSAKKAVVSQVRTVDQSVQPGDGGYGLNLEVFAFQQIVPRLDAYCNGLYSITPEETSGVPTYRSNPFEAVMSIGDSYMGRAGLEFLAWPRHSLRFSLGGRIEGVPVHDLVGGSDGFRRPGFSIGIEPGVSLFTHGWSFSAYAPVALYRNRERSVPDNQQSDATGIPRHGDAAFADYVLMFAVGRRF